MSELQKALSHPIWVVHKIGDTYWMDGNFKEPWKIAYYPIFEDGITGKKYSEPRALIEKPMKDGIDFREMPLRYLSRKHPYEVIEPNQLSESELPLTDAEEKADQQRAKELKADPEMEKLLKDIEKL